MLKKIALAVALVIVALVVYAALQPDEFRVERSVVINAPPEKIYPLIVDFHRWSAWSPWEKLDPALKRTFSGPDAGLGAVYAWDGNDKVGAGRMEITGAIPSSQVVIKLDFARPIEGHDSAEFTLQPGGATTKVTWKMRGPSPFLAKLMGVFVSMDRMIGGDFERGLAALKAAAEA
jgi:uncharacterized protein YndB with AHSA1/START domain